ncbi:MAG: hypothetical protein RBU29_17415, partial [bacterium]|nr:hypothetical protein [bacterium]
QNEVKKEPSNPKLQNDLLTAYKQKNWLDFAEEFFIRTIEDTSAPTIKSLSDIYFTKKDYGMLVELSQAGQRLYPDHADFYYNEGVGHYLAQDTNTLPRARECFIAASQKNPTAPLKKNIHWYLNRLQSKK